MTSGSRAGRPAPSTSPRTRGVAFGTAAVLTPGLLVSLLAGGPAQAVTLPPAPAMPPALSPGTETAPVFPLRSVPGYAWTTAVGARTKAGNGGLDKRFGIPTPAGSTLLWGDWDRDGAHTPAVFTGGHWVVYDAVVGQTPVPSREFDYGAPGDIPVAGDWNRDGRTDVGVVRGNVWLLRNAPDAGTTWKRRSYGAPGDTPVVGDWDGNGRDGIGVRRGARFYLRDSLGRKGRTKHRFAFGRKADLPVVGDWDGDGTDSVGVVRGQTWHLRSEATRKRRAKVSVVQRTVRRPSDPAAVPAPWATPAGPRGAACPTASAAVANRPQVGRSVRASKLLDKDLPYSASDPNLSTNPIFQLRNSLLEAERFLLGSQYLDRWYDRRGQNYVDVLDRFPTAEQEYAVRRPAMAALTTAVAARTRAHNDSVVGRPVGDAIRYTDWLVRSIACQHVAVTPGGWGGGWQSAHWAVLTAQAGWLVWDHLTPQTREYVAQMLVYEADRRLMSPVEYWADASGAIVAPGDTKAEENSWNSGVLDLAAAMLPKHEQATNWRRRGVDLAVASFARRADLNSTAVLNGVTVADRLDGANAYDDGTVENHRILHPDYMTNIQHIWWAADVAGLAGRSVPEANFFNAEIVYGAFANLAFEAGAASPANGMPFDQPGGTMYRHGSNDIYFPQGSTWGTVRRAHFISFDAHAWAYGLDGGAAWSARDALAAHVAGQQALVASNGSGDGRTYNFDPPTAHAQERYNGREEYAASQLATGWLALYVGANAWDKTFNRAPVDRTAYPPLPPMTQAETGWFGFGNGGGSSPDEPRLSP
jgi:hypothetical protein